MQETTIIVYTDCPDCKSEQINFLQAIEVKTDDFYRDVDSTSDQLLVQADFDKMTPGMWQDAVLVAVQNIAYVKVAQQYWSF